ncbi:hypothetical protein OSB04_024730 [Centaurea solstitialis]|uniref:Uncharacterized protein n=1 Tax=Centaurea solstitialis TaxID=347529 RepID=A0AA38SMB5_9ASTR|nr:hypothetical protein OSB04_024730 [Centaurea solstitialis]
MVKTLGFRVCSPEKRVSSSSSKKRGFLPELMAPVILILTELMATVTSDTLAGINGAETRSVGEYFKIVHTIWWNNSYCSSSVEQIGCSGGLYTICDPRCLSIGEEMKNWNFCCYIRFFVETSTKSSLGRRERGPSLTPEVCTFLTISLALLDLLILGLKVGASPR